MTHTCQRRLNLVPRLGLRAGLCSLQELSLDGNRISSLQPLSGLSNLQVLSAAHNQITRLDGVEVRNLRAHSADAQQPLHLQAYKRSAEHQHSCKCSCPSSTTGFSAAAAIALTLITHLLDRCVPAARDLLCRVYQACVCWTLVATSCAGLRHWQHAGASA